MRRHQAQLGEPLLQEQTPIHLVTWDHIAHLSRMLTKDGGEWHLFKSDHEAAYKQLPISPDDQWGGIVALRRPASGKWLGFATRTLVIGSFAAVLRYNILSAIWTAPVFQLLGIPLSVYFGDFASLIRAGLADQAIRVFPRFCAMMGFLLKPAKSSVGNAMVFLGLLGAFPPPAKDRHLTISPRGGE